MRIVAGVYGGRKLILPRGRDIRPTTDKVRSAIFNALRSRGVVERAHVLDAFCGSGALGLEALSQGAASCTFMDKNRNCLALARKNAEMLGVENAVFLLKDATKPGQAPRSFDLIFLDPPYDRDLVPPVLSALREQGWLADETMVVVEMEKRYDPGNVPEHYTVTAEKLYGDTRVLFLDYTAVNQAE